MWVGISLCLDSFATWTYDAFFVPLGLQAPIKDRVSGRDAPSLLPPRSTLTSASTSAETMEDISTKAYAQWVTIDIINSSSKEVVIKNVHLPWGKFYKDGKLLVSSLPVSWCQILTTITV